MTVWSNQQEISGSANRLMWMYGKIAYVVLLIFHFFYLENNVSGQVQVTGHVFAEIVEPTALSAKASNNHYIPEDSGDSNKLQDDILIAEVKLSGYNVNIGVSVQSGKLVSSSGETLMFNAIATYGNQVGDGTTSSMDKAFTFHGIPVGITHAKKNSTYNGQYRVTFMYD